MQSPLARFCSTFLPKLFRNFWLFRVGCKRSRSARYGRLVRLSLEPVLSPDIARSRVRLQRTLDDVIRHIFDPESEGSHELSNPPPPSSRFWMLPCSESRGLSLCLMAWRGIHGSLFSNVTHAVARLPHPWAIENLR